MTISQKSRSEIALYKLSMAKHDPAHCLMPNLFRTYSPDEYIPRMRDGEVLYERNKKGEIRLKNGKPIVMRHRPGYIIEHTFGDFIFKFSVAEGLGADDLRVLQGLVALAGANILILGPTCNEELPAQLRLDLELQGHASEKNTVVVRDSFYRLAKEIGYSQPDSGSAMTQLRESIERMFNVSVIAHNQKTKRSEGFRLIATYESNEQENSLIVALNPRIADAILKSADNGYTRIELSEVRAIKLEGTRILHQRLCGWINPGKEHEVSIETLCGYIWADSVETNTSKYRKRASKVREALAELGSIGWTVDYYKKNYVRIGRPRFGTSAAQEISFRQT